MATIFRSGSVIVGAGELIEKGAVTINGNMVTFVGPTKKVKPSKKDNVFDISGKTIWSPMRILLISLIRGLLRRTLSIS